MGVQPGVWGQPSWGWSEPELGAPGKASLSPLSRRVTGSVSHGLLDSYLSLTPMTHQPQTLFHLFPDSALSSTTVPGSGLTLFHLDPHPASSLPPLVRLPQGRGLFP